MKLRNVTFALSAVSMLGLAMPSLACDGHKSKDETTTSTANTKKDADKAASKDAPQNTQAKPNPKPNS